MLNFVEICGKIGTEMIIIEFCLLSWERLDGLVQEIPATFRCRCLFTGAHIDDRRILVLHGDSPDWRSAILKQIRISSGFLHSPKRDGFSRRGFLS